MYAYTFKMKDDSIKVIKSGSLPIMHPALRGQVKELLNVRTIKN